METHPTVSLALRGAPIGSVRGFALQPQARQVLFQWLDTQGLRGIPELPTDSSHQARLPPLPH